VVVAVVEKPFESMVLLAVLVWRAGTLVPEPPLLPAEEFQGLEVMEQLAGTLPKVEQEPPQLLWAMFELQRRSRKSFQPLGPLLEQYSVTSHHLCRSLESVLPLSHPR